MGITTPQHANEARKTSKGMTRVKTDLKHHSKQLHNYAKKAYMKPLIL